MFCKARSRITSTAFSAVIALAASAIVTRAEASATTAHLLAAQNVLTARLIDKLAANSPGANIVVSPASLAGALAVIEFGADEQLRRNLHEILGFVEPSARPMDFDALRKATSRSHGNGPLIGASAVFFDTRSNPRLEAIGALNGAGVSTNVEEFAKPETLAAINTWVSEQTKGKIPVILDRMPAEAGLVVLNALYFKDRWKQPFAANETRSTPFHLVGGKAIEIPLMRAADRRFRFRQDNHFVAVDLPYATDAYSLVVVTTRRDPVPAKDFSAVEGWLTGEGFGTAPGEIVLPKFDASSNLDLMPTLKSLGLKPPNTLPGFARGQLRIAKAQQRVELTIDEEGTEAAAATAVTELRSADGDYVKFSADKPFIFALRDQNSGLIVLAGYIANPQKAAPQSEEAQTKTQ
jgi:serine protease inhibitor